MKVLGMSAESGRWLLVVVGMIIQLCLGGIYAYGVVRVPLQTYFTSQLGLTVSAMDMTWPFIIFLLVFALTMPLAGPYIQRLGPRKVCMAGGALCGLGWFAASFATSPMMIALLYGVIGGIGVGIAYGCPIATSSQWFPDRRGLAVGLTVLGFGFSAALIAPINDYLTAYFGGATDPSAIMATMKVLGIAFLVITVVFSTFLRTPPTGWKPAGWTPQTPKGGTVQKSEYMRKDMTKTSTFFGLWICYIIGSLAGLTAIGIAKPVGLEVAGLAGMEPAAAGALMTSLTFPFALFNGIGRPIFGSLTDRLTPRNAAMVSYVLIFLSCILLYTNYSSIIVYTVSMAILWGCLGGWLAIAPAATPTYFGMKDNARNYGLVFTAYGVGAAVGGIVSAQAKDLIGAYQPFFLIVAGMAALGIVVAFTLMKPPHTQADARL
jgi:MFS family permease